MSSNRSNEFVFTNFVIRVFNFQGREVTMDLSHYTDDLSGVALRETLRSYAKNGKIHLDATRDNGEPLHVVIDPSTIQTMRDTTWHQDQRGGHYRCTNLVVSFNGKLNSNRMARFSCYIGRDTGRYAYLASNSYMESLRQRRVDRIQG